MNLKRIEDYNKKIDIKKKQLNELRKEFNLKIEELSKKRLKLKEDIIITNSILFQIHSKYFNMIISFFTFFSGLYVLIEIINWLEPNMNKKLRCVLFIIIFIILLIIIIIMFFNNYLKKTNRFSKSLKGLWEQYDKNIGENNLEVKKFITKEEKLSKEINDLEKEIKNETFVKKK